MLIIILLLGMFFSSIFVKKKSNKNTILKNEETKEDQEEDYLPESETLNKAKLRQINEKEDVAFLDEFLSLIDKNLPEEDEYILAFQNDLPTYGNTIHTNAFKVKPAKFPVETLDVEIQEARQKQLEEKENIQIA